MQNFRNLMVWQMARKLTKSIYQLAAKCPMSEEFGLEAQMRRAAISICSNIAEGCGHGSDPRLRKMKSSTRSSWSNECWRNSLNA